METDRSRSIVPDEVHLLADQVGDFIEYWGFRKIEGRIWTYLFLSKTALNAEQLMQLTGISKAMLSLSLQQLLEYDVVRKAFPDRERGQAYIANPNVMEVIGQVLRTRERQLLGKIHSSYHCAKESLKAEPSTSIHPERLQFLGQMVKSSVKLLDSFLSLQSLDLIPFRSLQLAPPLSRNKKTGKDQVGGK